MTFWGVVVHCLGVLGGVLVRVLGVLRSSGGDGELVSMHGADRLDGADQMKNLFTVLDTDTTAAMILNSNGAESIAVLQSDYTAGAEFGSDHQVTNSENGEIAGRISNAMSDGLMAAANDMTHDERFDVAKQYYEDGLHYEIGRSIIKAGLEFVPKPYAIPLKAGYEILNPIVKDQMIGQAPYTGDLTSDEAKAAIANAEPEVYGSKPQNWNSLANFIDGFDKNDPRLKEENLQDFLDEDGNVDHNAVHKDPTGFRSAADAALGALDDEWTNAYDRAADNPNWSQ